MASIAMLSRTRGPNTFPAKTQLRAAIEIGLAVGEVVNAKKMAQALCPRRPRRSLHLSRKVDQIATEAKLDGRVLAAELSTAHAVQPYTNLSRVVRAYRSTVHLEIRSPPLECRPRIASFPRDIDLDASRAELSSSVASTELSPAAKSQKAIRRNPNGDRVNSFAGLIDQFGTLKRNTIGMSLAGKHPFTLMLRFTLLQGRRPGACPDFTSAAARWIARLPMTAFATRLRTSGSPRQSAVSDQINRQVSGWESTSAGDVRLRGAH
jgi:hypothetical protein